MSIIKEKDSVSFHDPPPCTRECVVSVFIEWLKLFSSAKEKVYLILPDRAKLKLPCMLMARSPVKIVRSWHCPIKCSVQCTLYILIMPMKCFNCSLVVMHCCYCKNYRKSGNNSIWQLNFFSRTKSRILKIAIVRLQLTMRVYTLLILLNN